MARGGEFGRMAALHGDRMTSIPLADIEGVKEVDLGLLDVAKRFFS